MTDSNDSWDAFWAEVAGEQRTEVIRGIEVPVPTNLPLALEKRATDLEDSERFEDYAELVGRIFGPDVLTRWVDAGMGLRELQVVLTWGMAQGSGQDMSFREAFETVMKADDEGKPEAPAGANRAARRAAQKKPSAGTGGRSRRTSSASTASTRAASHG